MFEYISNYTRITATNFVNLMANAPGSLNLSDSAGYAAVGSISLAAGYLAYRKIYQKTAPTEHVESTTERLFREEQEKLRAKAEILAKETARLEEFLASKHITECYLPPYIDRRSSALKPVLDSVTQEIINVEKTKMAEAVRNSKEVPPSLAFYGPAGTGKTTLMATLPYEVGFASIHIEPALLHKYMQLGKAEELLMDIKHESTLYATKTGRPVMLILEDCEQLFAKRKSDEEKKIENKPLAAWEENQLGAAQLFKQYQDAFVNACLRELGKEEDRRICFGLTLNESRKWIIDDALATRLKYIHIPPPNEQRRKKILELHIPKYFNNDLTKMRFFDMGRLEQMAMATEGFTGRNLIRVLEDIRSQMQLAGGDLNRGMVESAINKVAQSIEQPKPAYISSPGSIAAQTVATAVENTINFITAVGANVLERLRVIWTKPAAVSSKTSQAASEV